MEKDFERKNSNKSETKLQFEQRIYFDHEDKVGVVKRGFGF